MDAISDGPLGVVFGHVDYNLQLQSAALVCQRWRRLLQLLTSLVSSLVVSSLVDPSCPSPSPSPTPAGPMRLTEGALRCMGDWFRHLTALDLSGCTVSSPAALTAAMTGSLEGLTTLRLAGNTAAVTNETLSVITARCTRLTSLDLTHCRQVTSGLAALASLNQLQRLCLAYCKGVTGDDDCLGTVVGGAKSLTSLDLTHCRGLTKQGIRNLAAHLTTRASSSTTAAPLAHLCLAYVHAVQDTGLEAIVESCGKELLSLDVTQVTLTSNITPSRLVWWRACVCVRLCAWWRAELSRVISTSRRRTIISTHPRHTTPRATLTNPSPHA